MADFTLVVTSPFDAHDVGDRITDPEEVAKLMDHPHTMRVPVAAEAGAPTPPDTGNDEPADPAPDAPPRTSTRRLPKES